MSITELITNLPNIIGDAVETNALIGYIVILLAMFLENIIPPIPSEIIMPLAGFYVYQGQLEFIPVILAGLAGTLLGAFPWYGLGRMLNEKRLEKWLDSYGKWLGVSKSELSNSREWFNKYGNALIFWGRLVPGIRTLISVPAGIELMPIVPFTIWTTAGSLIWTILLTVAGIVLGESYTRVEVFLDPFSSIIKKGLIISFIILSIYLVIKTIKKNKK